MTTTAPYGSWKSPITATNITKGSVKLSDVVVDPVTTAVYHIESRPSEGGRSVLVDSHTGRDIVDNQWNVRTGVQEYGGGPAIVRAGVAYFSNFADGRVYSVDIQKGAQPRAITPESNVLRYADMDVHPQYPHLLVSVLEDHSDSSTPVSTVNTLCIINIKSQTVLPLVTGADFYAAPKFSPDGSRIVWQQWYLPDMPWQGSEITVADVSVQGDKLEVKSPAHVAGSKRTNSVSYPFWASANTLLFTSDKSGYQNPWKYDLKVASPLFPSPLAEDVGEPAWILGRSPYAVIDSGKRALFSAIRDGRYVLYLVDLSSGARQNVETPYVGIQNMHAVGADKVAFIGESTDAGPELVLCTIGSGTTPQFSTLFKPTKSAAGPDFPTALFSVAQPMTLKAEPDEHPVHVVFYPPTNPAYSGTSVSGEKPPCVINAHGGPTHFLGHELNMITQYYTSRGWAWLNVNFGGSSGYGRAYTERLAGNWGIVDIEDCIQAAKILSSAPYSLVDPARLVITGGSSGGYTSLGAISRPPSTADLRTFAAATSSYGISDLRLLMQDTHKFESGYADQLIGGTIEEIPEVYRERSPVTHADEIVAPLLILQGDIDRVVPKEQAETIYESIKRRGGVVEYKLYPGEGHGWRKEETMVDALEREIKFYERVLKIQASS